MYTPGQDQEVDDNNLPIDYGLADTGDTTPETEMADLEHSTTGMIERGQARIRRHLGPIAGALAVTAAIAGLAVREMPNIVGTASAAEATAGPRFAKLPKLNPLDLPTIAEAKEDLKEAGFTRAPRIVPTKSGKRYPVAEPGKEYVTFGWARRIVVHSKKNGKTVQTVTYPRLMPSFRLATNRQVYMKIKEVQKHVEVQPDLTKPVEGIPPDVMPKDPNPGTAPHPIIEPTPPISSVPPETQPPVGEVVGLHSFDKASGYSESLNPTYVDSQKKATVQVLRKLKGVDDNGNPYPYVKWTTGTMVRLPKAGQNMVGVLTVTHGIKEETGDADGFIPRSVLPSPADFGPKSKYDYISAIPGPTGQPLKVIAAHPALLAGPESDDSFFPAVPIASAPDALDNFPTIDWKQTQPPRPGSPGFGYAMPETTLYAPIGAPNRFVCRLLFRGYRKIDIVAYKKVTPSPTDPGGSGGKVAYNNGTFSGGASFRGAFKSPLAFDNQEFGEELIKAVADQCEITINPEEFPSLEGYNVDDNIPHLVSGLGNPAP